MSVESLVDRMKDTCRGLFVGRTWAGGCGCHGVVVRLKFVVGCLGVGELKY